MLNKTLFQLAEWSASGNEGNAPLPGLQKSAVVPPGGGDPSMGGAAPGGAPGGPAPPPGDPAMAGAPAGDPAMAGAPAPPPPVDPAMVQAIAQQVAQLMGGGGGVPGGAPGAPGAGGPMGMKPPTKKVDPAILDTKLWQIMKMVALLLEHAGVSIPADLALGPPPDPASMAAANADQQTAMGGMGGGAPPAPAGDPAAAGGAAPPPDAGAIPPIEPIQGAAPVDAAGGQQKMGSGISRDVLPQRPESAVSVLARRCREMNSAVGILQ